MLKSANLFVYLFLLVLASEPARSDEPEIRKSIEAYTAAFNRGDIDAMANAWTETAVWIHADGTRHEGLPAIRNELQNGMAGKGTLEIIESRIRLVTSGVAAEEGKARLVVDGQLIGEERYEALHVATDSGWKLASLREFPADEVVTENSPLKPLEWLVGDWVDESPDARVVSRVEWTRNRAFLVNNFSADFSAEDSLEGVQVIGWDPAQGVIRSWLFDTDGAFGEGTWQLENGNWFVRSRMTLADGREASSTNIYSPQSENSYSWRSIGRKVDGQFLPNIPKTLVIRAGSSPAGGANSQNPDNSTAPNLLPSGDDSTDSQPPKQGR